MNDDNTMKLFNDFPDFFKHKDNLHASLMGFGFECGNGWFDLVYNLCSDIKKSYNGVIPDSFYVVQVKEKFGGLRFYVTATTKEIHDLIHVAENESFYFCEHCGKRNPMYVKGKSFHSFYRDSLPWILTLCDDCLSKHVVKKGLEKGDYVSSWQKEKCAPFVEESV